ncbi:chitinase [Synchytrium microbalum]|uniref:chitinase n=1 Tax=Synchytrium microbalum TaxID=1806994 RepID=A0A507BZ89_9FUNG|nr:chitinase [Synchytrium microbalum]TPX32742.1 chitinase [Synchytrium microbalum]
MALLIKSWILASVVSAVIAQTCEPYKPLQLLVATTDDSQSSSSKVWTVKFDECLPSNTSTPIALTFRLNHRVAVDFDLAVTGGIADCNEPSQEIVHDYEIPLSLLQSGYIKQITLLNCPDSADTYIQNSFLSTCPEPFVREQPKLSKRLPVSTTGKCGTAVGLQCAAGYCCSSANWCGTTTAYCSTGCQPQFGNCSSVQSATSPTSSKSVLPPMDTSLPVSVDYACGLTAGTRCPTDYCCSTAGWCGKSSAYCAVSSCQPLYGICGVASPAVAGTSSTATSAASFTTTKSAIPSFTTKSTSTNTPIVTSTTKVVTSSPSTASSTSTTTNTQVVSSMTTVAVATSVQASVTSQVVLSSPSTTTNTPVASSTTKVAVLTSVQASATSKAVSASPKISTTVARSPTTPAPAQSPTPSLPISINYSCGPSAGTQCPVGYCCSIYGYCGTSDAYCAATNCLTGYGICNGATSPNVVPSSLPSATKAPVVGASGAPSPVASIARSVAPSAAASVARSAAPSAAPSPAPSSSSTLTFDQKLSQGKVISLYWGQNTLTKEKSLVYYCDPSLGNPNTQADILIISFAYIWPSGVLPGTASQMPLLDLAGHCGSTYGSTKYLNCPSLGTEIQTCQRLGKKVFLSLGGATGTFDFASGSAVALATAVWNLYLGGTSAPYSNYRPFGTGVVLDGIDFDIEQGSSSGFALVGSTLRTYMNFDTSKKYYISAAPQCVYPDAWVGPGTGTLLSDPTVKIDIVGIQFYNNYCGVSYWPSVTNKVIGNSYNFALWVDSYVASVSWPVKLIVLVPATTASAANYASPDVLKPLLAYSKALSSSFAGVGMWDAGEDSSSSVSLAGVSGLKFSNAMRLILNQI